MDATVLAVPVYFGTMGGEYLYLRKRAETRGPSPADYERRDTVTSLTMGVASRWPMRSGRSCPTACWRCSGCARS